MSVQLVNEDGSKMTAQESSEYVANTAIHGSEGFYAVQARKDDGKLYDVCHTGNGPDSEWNASAIAEAVNYHERLIEALHHAMQCWEYDGVSDEHGAVAAECSAILAKMEQEQAQ
jgi:hypothetical protein